MDDSSRTKVYIPHSSDKTLKLSAREIAIALFTSLIVQIKQRHRTQAHEHVLQFTSLIVQIKPFEAFCRVEVNSMFTSLIVQIKPKTFGGDNNIARVYIPHSSDKTDNSYIACLEHL